MNDTSSMVIVLSLDFLVFGWLNGTTFEGLERGDPYTLTVGFIKGTLLSVSQLTVNVTADTAGKLLITECTIILIIMMQWLVNLLQCC